MKNKRREFLLILILLISGFFYSQNISAADKININTATLEELDALPGIGLSKAQSIIDYRSVQPFLVIEDIMKVSGIKQAVFDGLKDLITVGVEIATPAEESAGQTGDQGAVAPAAEQAASSTPAGANATGSKLGDVVINEFVADPADGQVEWIELYNRGGREIDLAGWCLADGSGAQTDLSGSLAAADFKIIEKPAGNLNNGGDLIILSDGTSKIIDQVAYGNWDDGDLSNNAPAAADPDSIARLFDGYNTFNNANDFALTLKPTKGLSNLIQAADEISPAAKAGYDYSDDLLISEFFPNPSGDDSQDEFIELRNTGSRPVNLNGWSLSKEDNKKKFLQNMATSTVILPGQYLALYRPKTKIVLPNDRGEIRLFEPLAEKPARTVQYENAQENRSYNESAGEWFWSENITPGQANSIKMANRAPVAAFSLPAEIAIGQPVVFDGSDSADADGDKLAYEWDFGDGFKNNLISPEHTYFQAGVYKVKLAVDDGQEIAVKEKILQIMGGLVLAVASDPSLSGNIEINEIFPNPAGADTGQEWLEFFNRRQDKVNLLGWRVENGNGRYKFKENLWLNGQGFYVLKNSLSRLALKNSADAVILYNNSDQLADQVEYAEAVQGASYARGLNGKWFWTTKLTPGKENVISMAENQESLEFKASSIKVGADIYAETTLEKVKDLEIGSLVKVKGTVSAEPGVLGSQIFYITGSPGIQIYNYKKDFPVLKIGDYLEVSGELSQAQGEARLKTKNKNDIKIISHQKPPVALAINCDQISEENVGQLVSVRGEITDKKSSTVYFDDGSGEVEIYLKKNTGLTGKNFTVGQPAAVTGILSKTSTGLKLLPRSAHDLVLDNGSAGNGLQVLGEVATGGEWDLAERNKKQEFFEYLLVLAGGAIIVLTGLLIKARKNN